MKINVLIVDDRPQDFSYSTLNTMLKMAATAVFNKFSQPESKSESKHNTQLELNITGVDNTAKGIEKAKLSLESKDDNDKIDLIIMDRNLYPEPEEKNENRTVGSHGADAVNAIRELEEKHKQAHLIVAWTSDNDAEEEFKNADEFYGSKMISISELKKLLTYAVEKKLGKTNKTYAEWKQEYTETAVISALPTIVVEFPLDTSSDEDEDSSNETPSDTPSGSPRSPSFFQTPATNQDSDQNTTGTTLNSTN